MNSNRCSGCKIMRCDCLPNCILAPHFPLKNLKSFERLHKIFEAGNVFKILTNLEPVQREIAVKALYYEAEARERNPILGYLDMFHYYQDQLKILERQILSTKNDLANIIGPDQVPQYSSLPMPNDFMTTKSALQSYIKIIEGLNEIQKNEHMQLLPPADAQRMVNEIVRKKEDEMLCDGHGDAGPSTSSYPSMDIGSTNATATHKTLSLPQNQNQS